MASPGEQSSWREYATPTQLTLLTVNAVCFGGCVAFLAVGRSSGPLLLLTIGTGLSMSVGLTGALLAARQARKTNQDRPQ